MKVFRLSESVCKNPALCLQSKLEMLTKSTTCELPDPYGYPEETYTDGNMRKMCNDFGLCQWFMNSRLCEGRDLRNLCCPSKSLGRFGTHGQLDKVLHPKQRSFVP